jgi:hypothetical protein
MRKHGLVLVGLFLVACSSAAPPKAPPAGGEGGGSEEGGTGGTPTGGKVGTGGSTGTGGAVVPADAAPAVEKDSGVTAPADATAPADQAVTGGEGGASGGGEALMVVGTVPTIGSDIQIREELMARGLKVTEVLDSMATPAMAAGKKIVVLSYSIDSEEVTGKFNEAEGCIILMEHNLLPSLGMTAANGHGYQLPSTQISIIKPEHPLAAGFMGDVTVISVKNGDVFWGVPAESAIKIATVKGNANRVVLFGYEKDAMMVGRKAPGKRLQFFLGAHNVPTKYLTAEGLKVLDASIDWCAK